MSRIARVVAVGLPHHVTQRGNNRGQVFFDDDDRRFYLWTLAQYRRKYGADVWGYCLMDNHMHALAVPHEADSLARCFAGTNLTYTQHVNRKQGRSGRLWQNRFFSCPVDKDEYLWPVLRYIDRNPVRSKAVRQAWEYQWSSARHHVTGEADPLLNEPDWLLAELRRQKYRSYLRDESEEKAAEIRRMTATGRHLGGTEFLSVLESHLERVLSVQKRGRPRTSLENREVSLFTPSASSPDPARSTACHAHMTRRTWRWQASPRSARRTGSFWPRPNLQTPPGPVKRRGRSPRRVCSGPQPFHRKWPDWETNCPRYRGQVHYGRPV